MDGNNRYLAHFDHAVCARIIGRKLAEALATNR